MNNRVRMFAGIVCAGVLAAPVHAVEVNKGVLKKIQKAAIAGFTLDNVGGTANKASDDKFVREAVEYAFASYNKGITALAKWELVNAPDTSDLEKQLSDLKSSKIAVGVLDKLAMANKLPVEIKPEEMMELSMATMMGNQEKMEALKGKLISQSVSQLQDELNAARSAIVWANGLSGIPYMLICDMKRNDSKSSALNEILVELIKDYCAKNGLDGVLIVHLASLTGEPKDIRVIVQGNRVMSSFKMNPTMVVLSKEGKIGFDLGAPRMDDLAPIKWAVPIFIGDAVQGGAFTNIRKDLADPAGKALAEYKELIDKTAGKLAEKVGEKIP